MCGVLFLCVLLFPGATDWLWECCVRCLCCAAHPSDPILQTGLPHPFVKGWKKKNKIIRSVSIHLITDIFSLCNQQQNSKEFPIYIPTVHRQVDENMKVAQKRNAVQEGMFYFRKDIYKGQWRRRWCLVLASITASANRWCQWSCVVFRQAAPQAWTAQLRPRMAWRPTVATRSTRWWASTTSSTER